MRKELQQVLDDVGSLCGLSMSARPAKATALEGVDFRIAGLDSPNGVGLTPFRTALGLGVRTQWDLFSGDLVKRVSQFSQENPEFVESVVLGSEEFGVEFTATADGGPFPSRSVPVDGWTHLALTWFVYESPESDEFATVRKLLRVATPALFDLLSGPEEGLEKRAPGEPEGNRILGTCQRYERSAANRAACLEHYGPTCKACGLSPAERYGDGGAAIIHVHHLTPLSQMGSARALSPVEDLVPLCPNCHNFAHKRTPPYEPDEIRELLGLKTA